MHISILYSLPTERLSSSEFSITDDDTIVAAKIIQKTCRRLGMQTSMFPLSVDNPEKVAEIAGDCVFNLIEWTGSDINSAKKTYEILDSMDIAYTGADWEGYVVSSEKTLMKKKFEEIDVPTPRSTILSTDGYSLPQYVTGNSALRFPLIVKLASDHCSIGLERASVVHTFEELSQRVEYMMKTFKQDVLVEEFIAGREFQVAAIERNGVVQVLPFSEIGFYKPDELNFLTFAGRWDEEHPDFKLAWMDVAQDVSTDVQQTIEREGKKIFKRLHMHDYVRFDIRVRGEEVFFLEVNANPGIDDSLECGVTLAADAAGISFDDLIGGIILSSVKRKKKEKRESLKRVSKDSYAVPSL